MAPQGDGQAVALGLGGGGDVDTQPGCHRFLPDGDVEVAGADSDHWPAQHDPPVWSSACVRGSAGTAQRLAARSKTGEVVTHGAVQ